MSALGHKQTELHHAAMSALPPKADIERSDGDVRFVPTAAVSNRSKQLSYSISSSARSRNDSGTVRPIAFEVLRLTISSSLVGSWTGRSPGFAPLRILST